MVLFTSCRTLKEAANLRAVYEAYKGSKAFEVMSPRSDNMRHLLDYDLLVTDEIPKYSKAPVIMICHGASAGKSYGLDQPYPYVSREHTKLLTYVLSTSEETIPFVASWAGCEESKVLPLGMPRMDVYEGKKKGDGGTFLKDYRRAYLYCPTYRSREEGPLPEINWQYIECHLEEDEVFVVKVHPLSPAPALGAYRNIIAVPASEPSGPYLMDCDVLITDFSSIMFDAHVLRKPVVLFEKDWQRYKEARGMSLKYPEMYSTYHCEREDILMDLLRMAKRTSHDEEIRRFVCGACDGHSTERVIKLIDSCLRG